MGVWETHNVLNGRDPADQVIVHPTGRIVEGCHGPARGHALSLGQAAVPRLPTIEVGNRDVSLETHSIQNREELADVTMLWDAQHRASMEESRLESDG